MIRLTRMNHASVVLNADLIEHIESTPDTLISLTTGQKVVVLDSPEQVIAKVVAFRKSIGPTCAACKAEAMSRGVV